MPCLGNLSIPENLGNGSNSTIRRVRNGGGCIEAVFLGVRVPGGKASIWSPRIFTAELSNFGEGV